ncbi:17117_t:CDS:2, partial [Dentiscutata erythropus]
EKTFETFDFNVVNDEQGSYNEIISVTNLKQKKNKRMILNYIWAYRENIDYRMLRSFLETNYSGFAQFSVVESAYNQKFITRKTITLASIMQKSTFQFLARTFKQEHQSRVIGIFFISFFTNSNSDDVPSLKFGDINMKTIELLSSQDDCCFIKLYSKQKFLIRMKKSDEKVLAYVLMNIQDKELVLLNQEKREFETNI